MHLKLLLTAVTHVCCYPVCNVSMHQNEVNFEEAVAVSHKAYAPPGQLPDDVQTLLEAAKTQTLTAESSTFDILLKAVADFMAQEGKGENC